MKVNFYLNGIKYGEASQCVNKRTGNSFLYNLEVLRSFRGRGLSHITVLFMIKNFGVNELYVRKDNKRALRVYKRFGFRAVQSYGDNYWVMRRAGANSVHLD